MEKSTFGQFIYSKRRELNLTQKDLAKRLFVTESAVSKWERGVSYPDISLVQDLCAVLGVSERELLTSSEDTSQRKIERQAATLRRLRKAWLIAWEAMLGIALLTCFIVNLAVERRLSWFFIVFAAEALAFCLVALPLILKERGLSALWSMGAAYGALHLLLLVCCVYTGGRWFPLAAAGIALGCATAFGPLLLWKMYLPGPLKKHRALLALALDSLLLFVLLFAAYAFAGQGYGGLIGTAVPIALFWLPLPWICLLAIRYLPLHGLIRAGICLAAGAVFSFFGNPAMAVIIDGGPFALPGVNLLRWTEYTSNGNTAVLILALALCLALWGAVKALRGRKAAQPRSDL